MSSEEIKQLKTFQVNEITEYHIYNRLSRIQKNAHNRQILSELAEEEMKHYRLLEKYTGCTPAPDRWKIRRCVWVARLFGLTFGIKLMEKGEVIAQHVYKNWDNVDLQTMATEEEKHEIKLIGLIDEEGLNYMSSVVLGLNDALVEFTGALAGYTFALQSPRLVALTGGITGIAAALSMAASEYLSTRAEKDGKKCNKSIHLHRNCVYNHCYCIDSTVRIYAERIRSFGCLPLRSLAHYRCLQLLLCCCT